MGKAKATREFDLEDFPGQPLKLTISASHGEPLSGCNTRGYDLLTCLIPSGTVHFSKISHSPCSSLHRDDPSGHLFCNQQLRYTQASPDILLESGRQRNNGFSEIHSCDKARRQISRKGRAGWRLRNMETKFQEVRLHSGSASHDYASPCVPRPQQGELVFKHMEGSQGL